MERDTALTRSLTRNRQSNRRTLSETKTNKQANSCKSEERKKKRKVESQQNVTSTWKVTLGAKKELAWTCIDCKVMSPAI